MTRKKKKDTRTKRLFRKPSGQGHLFEKSLEEELEAKANTPVECLGMTFENDEKRLWRIFLTGWGSVWRRKHKAAS